MSHIAGSNIRVDNFQYRSQDKTNYAYFLSHCHEDHLKGLSNNWSHGKIYASHCSKLIITEKFKNLKDFVVDLEMDEEHWIYLDEEKKEGVSVVLMDAFHCPGAVMFLFKGKMGTVLHTGDFRFDDKMLRHELLCPEEKRNAAMRAITVDVDYLHLDNTFADPGYDFPARDEAYQGLVNIVKTHKEHRVFLFAYNLGKEEVFLQLADDFKAKIVVDNERMAKVKLMDLRPELFTTNPDESLFHIKSIKDLNGFDINACNRECPTIFVILTGWNDKYNRNLPFYFKVPYSSHSNYRELERFVKAVNPRKLIFNVSDRANTKRRHDFQTYLTKEYERGNKQLTTGTNSVQSIAQSQKVGGFTVSQGMQIQKGSSLLHPSIGAAKANTQGQNIAQIEDEQQTNINGGYKGAVKEMSSRFDVNNRELNKRKFQDQYGHIMNTSKAKGAKFLNTEVTFDLTPPQEEPSLLYEGLDSKVMHSNMTETVEPHAEAMQDRNDFLDLESENSIQQKCEVAVDTMAEQKISMKRRFKEVQSSFDQEPVSAKRPKLDTSSSGKEDLQPNLTDQQSNGSKSSDQKLGEIVETQPKPTVDLKSLRERFQKHQQQLLTTANEHKA